MMPETSPSPLIRTVRPADREQWEELFLAYGVFYETAFTPEILEGVWQWLMDAAHPVSCFVVEGDGVLLGFAHLREHPDTFVAGSSWFLDDLYTRPENRGQGVARALISALTNHVNERGGGTLRWITSSENTQARALYDQVT